MVKGNDRSTCLDAGIAAAAAGNVCIEVGNGGAVLTGDTGKQQGTSLFIQGHLAQQVSHTGIHILPPVLVNVQGAIPIEVFEVQAVSLDEFVSRVGTQCNLVSAGLDIEEAGVTLLDCAVSCK